MLAVSTLPVTIPIATDSQPTANAVSANSPTAPSQATGSVVGPEADQDRDHHHDRRRECGLDELPTTWPARTAARAIAIVRKRAMIPAVMSIATVIAVPCAVPTIVISRIPGMT